MSVLLGFLASALLMLIFFIVQAIVTDLAPIYIPFVIYLSMKICKFEVKSNSYHIKYFSLMFITVIILYFVSKQLFPLHTIETDEGTVSSTSGMPLLEILNGKWFLFTLITSLVLSIFYKYFIYRENILTILKSSALSLAFIVGPIITIWAFFIGAFMSIIENFLS